MKSVHVAFVALALSLTSPAQAQQIDLSTITCKDFFEGSKERVDFVVVWLLGFYTGEDDPPILDFGKMKDKAEKLGAYCAKNPNHGLTTAAEQVVAD
ncbi:MAG TPA: HdeA/HdeB family chaperone [Xanthobacteraceae bacterium]|jgi:acid stress chaperone HdeB